MSKNETDSSSEISFEEMAAQTTTNQSEEPLASAEDLEAVFDVPVRISAILGQTKLRINELLHLHKGQVLELNRKVGETIEVFVNDRLVARGEVVLINDKLGVTMTEIAKVEKH